MSCHFMLKTPAEMVEVADNMVAKIGQNGFQVLFTCTKCGPLRDWAW